MDPPWTHHNAKISIVTETPNEIKHMSGFYYRLWYDKGNKYTDDIFDKCLFNRSYFHPMVKEPPPLIAGPILINVSTTINSLDLRCY